MQHSSALYDPFKSATPSQRLAAVRHRERMCRLSVGIPVPTPVHVMAAPPTTEPAAEPIPDSMLALAHDQIDRLKMPLTQVQAIVRAVLAHYPYATFGDLKSQRRTASIVLPRQLAMYMVKKLTLMSLPATGRRFGGRDHTTVLHAVRKIAEQIKVDSVLAAQVADIEFSLTKVEIDG